MGTLLRPDPAHDGGSFGDGLRGRRAAPDRDASARVAHYDSRRHRAANAIDGRRRSRRDPRGSDPARAGHVPQGLGVRARRLTWFWIFYRFYKDADTLIYGHAPHFEHDDDDHH